MFSFTAVQGPTPTKYKLSSDYRKLASLVPGDKLPYSILIASANKRAIVY